MNTLAERAEKIKLGKHVDYLIKSQAETESKASVIRYILDEVLASFETEFADELPMLDEAGLRYFAKLNNERRIHEGAHIQFFIVEGPLKVLKMDYSLTGTVSGEPGWRYEHVTKGYGHNQFHKWPKDDFIVWIADFFFPSKTSHEK